MLCICFVNILTVVHRDKLGVKIDRSLAKLGHKLLHIGVAADKLAVKQRKILACVDDVTVKVRVAGCIGDLCGMHALYRLTESLFYRLDLVIGVKVQHCGDALRHGLCRNDNDLLVLTDGNTLLRRHNYILVVGENEHHLGRCAVYLLENVIGGGIHGLTAGNNGVCAQLAEQLRHSLACTYRDNAAVLHGGCDLLALKLALDILKIVGALRLSAGDYILVLGAHILNLCKLQSSVLLRLGQCFAGNVRMNMNLERLVVLADNKAVSDAGKVCAVRGQINIRLVLSDYEHGIKGIGYLRCVKNIECTAFVGYRRGGHRLGGDLYLAAQISKHSFKDNYVALAAGINNARLAQNGVNVHGVVKCLFSRLYGGVEHRLNVLGILCKAHRRGGRHACNRENSTLGRLHDRLVGCIDTVIHSGGKFLCADGLHALESARNSAEQQGQDNSGVASCAAQQCACNAVGSRIHGIVFLFSELGSCGIHGKTHIRAGITVGNREHIQLVYHLCIFCKCRIGAKNHVFKRRGINVISQRKHLREEKLYINQPIITVSTYTSTLFTGTPVAFATL